MCHGLSVKLVEPEVLEEVDLVPLLPDNGADVLSACAKGHRGGWDVQLFLQQAARPEVIEAGELRVAGVTGCMPFLDCVCMPSGQLWVVCT